MPPARSSRSVAATPSSWWGQANGNRMPSTRTLLLAMAASLAVAGLALAFAVERSASRSNSSPDLLNANDLDQRLQHAATLALGDRRGAIIVMDPQTGRIRAVVNSELAFTES